jgi:hypothetical protein
LCFSIINGDALALRATFPKLQIRALNNRCGFLPVMGPLTDIGTRSREAGFYTRDDFLFYRNGKCSPRLKISIWLT